jgi:hypothetical protein
MRSAAIVALGAAALVGCADGENIATPEMDVPDASLSRASENAPTRTFDITIQNLTTAGGQTFTPPLVALHQGSKKFFQVGKAASFGIQEIAENGNLDPMIQGLMGDHKVSSYSVAASGDGLPAALLQPGEAVTVSLSAKPGSQFVSFASMLICTNDGFTGVNGGKLPNKIGEEAEFYAYAYDAGTEINTEDFADLVPPCPALSGVPSDMPGTGMSNPDLAEGGAVYVHPGIHGNADLDPSIHGWAGPVSKLTVRRTG